MGGKHTCDILYSKHMVKYALNKYEGFGFFNIEFLTKKL